jgi:hypothetical protein
MARWARSPTVLSSQLLCTLLLRSELMLLVGSELVRSLGSGMRFDFCCDDIGNGCLDFCLLCFEGLLHELLALF